MELAQDRDGWPGTCGYGEELSGSINAGNFLTSGKVYWLASQEGLCSMEYVCNLNCKKRGFLPAEDRVYFSGIISSLGLRPLKYQ